MRAPSRYPKRSPSEWQQLRQAAVECFAAGERVPAVARALNVSHDAIRCWRLHWLQSQSAPPLHPRGPQPRLGPEQWAQLAAELERGPQAHGYHTELWTLQRIADLIRKLFGVRYHPGHVHRLLGALGFSCQKPEVRAKERDEAAIQRWLREDWPALKKGL